MQRNWQVWKMPGSDKGVEEVNEHDYWSNSCINVGYTHLGCQLDSWKCT